MLISEKCGIISCVSDQPAEIRSLETSTLSRREVLRLIVALCLTSPVSTPVRACRKSDPERQLTDPPSMTQLRAVIRTSPDPLKTRTEEDVVPSLGYQCRRWEILDDGRFVL